MRADVRRAERFALAYNPWGDDDSNYRVLANRMVVTRCSHECAVCFDVIPARARVRAQREVYDGQARTFYFCPRCCSAMAHACRTGNVEPLERRTQMGIDVGRRSATAEAANES